MSSEHLTGIVRGDTRAALIKQAKTYARAYFESDCVAVRLSNEKPWLGAFNADFEAAEHHVLTQKGAYGPFHCRDCGRKSWPHDPLPVVSW